MPTAIESNSRRNFFIGVSFLGLVTIITLMVTGNGEGTNGTAHDISNTGTPDPCEDALRSIAEHKQNYERILQNGASPEDIRVHGSEEGALAHYRGNGEQMQRSYDKHCT